MKLQIIPIDREIEEQDLEMDKLITAFFSTSASKVLSDQMQNLKRKKKRKKEGIKKEQNII